MDFFSRSSWNVSDGSIVRFSEDHWCRALSLESRFPSLTCLCSIQKRADRQICVSTSIADKIDWDFRFPRNLTNRGTDEVIDLIGIFGSVRICEGLKDRRVRLDDELEFSVKP